MVKCYRCQGMRGDIPFTKTEQLRSLESDLTDKNI